MTNRFEPQSPPAGRTPAIRAPARTSSRSGHTRRADPVHPAAAGAAGAILVLFWLPAEYGIDPTGVGRLTGLTEMGEIKQQLAAEAEADAATRRRRRPFRPRVPTAAPACRSGAVGTP